MDHTLHITALAHGGFGIGRIEGQVCFVPYALPGDEVKVRIARRAKGVLWGDIESVVTPSPDRIDPGCPVYGACGACSWLHFAYPAQARWKRQIVADCLQRIGGVTVDVAWADDPDHRLRYRTRAEFHGDGERVGFYAGASHDVVDVATCPLCHPRLNTALATLREICPRVSVEIVVNPEGDDVLVWTRRPVAAVADVFPAAQSTHDKMERAQFRFDGVPVVNGTFSQSSLLLNRVLTRIVHEVLNDAGRILDLYCGNGNLTLGLTPGRTVLGLDHNRAAVEAAQATGTGTYRAGDEGAFREALHDEAWDAVILDPPRTGAKTIAQDLASAAAQRIVYVACDPATLARDLHPLCAAGWRTVRTVAVDLFPNTPHIETVCVLER